jgi:hypothetical protein
MMGRRIDVPQAAGKLLTCWICPLSWMMGPCVAKHVTPTSWLVLNSSWNFLLLWWGQGMCLAAGKICKFSFEDLCGRPVAAADYLALTEHYHTIALSGVPIITAASRSEGYRFVTLIDVLYEHRWDHSSCVLLCLFLGVKRAFLIKLWKYTSWIQHIIWNAQGSCADFCRGTALRAIWKYCDSARS